jgi:glycosyltransferase involved in cell wall biosynthesis
VRLVVAGDGPDRARCERQATEVRSSQIEVEFRGWIDAAGRSRVLADASVVVLPSLWPEPFGLSGLEAAAAGVPVAAFGVGGIPEWLHQDVGRVAPADPPTADGLAAAILGCLAMTLRAPVTESALRDQQARHVTAVMATLDELTSQAPRSA